MARMEKFLLTYESKATKLNYRNALSNYFSIFYSEGTVEEKIEKYFYEKRDYEDDVEHYFASIINRPPKVVKVYMSMVKTFLSSNDVEFSPRFWKELMRKKKGNRALTLDRPPTIDELRRIVNYLPLDGKALFLMLASSGMRIGEALALKIGELNLNTDPASIRVRGEITKTGNPRIVFISNEARDIVSEWLRYRQEFMHKYSKAEDGHIFPFTYQSIVKIWYRALQKTSLNMRDQSTNWNLCHIHTLRKFFRTQMAPIIILDITEALMGHEGARAGPSRN